MLDVDSPGFAIALLAILAGARIALYLYERLATPDPVIAPTDVPAMALAPDEHLEPDVTVQTAASDAPAPPAPPPPQRARRFIADLSESGIIAVVLVFFLIRPFLLQAFYIPTGSMIPTLKAHDRVLATKFVYHFRPPRRGEVIVFHAPALALKLQGQPYDPAHPVEYVKRVIGIPGDHIRIKRYDGVYVNGVKLNEPYINDLPNYDFPCDPDGRLADGEPEARMRIARFVHGDELVIPEGYVFTLGDNRQDSLDGHRWGPLERNRVVGKVFFIFLPLDRKGVVK